MQVDGRAQGNVGLAQVDGPFGVFSDVVVAGFFIFSGLATIVVGPFELYAGDEGSVVVQGECSGVLDFFCHFVYSFIEIRCCIWG